MVRTRHKSWAVVKRMACLATNAADLRGPGKAVLSCPPCSHGTTRLASRPPTVGASACPWAASRGGKGSSAAQEGSHVITARPAVNCRLRGTVTAPCTPGQPCPEAIRSVPGPARAAGWGRLATTVARSTLSLLTLTPIAATVLQADELRATAVSTCHVATVPTTTSATGGSVASTCPGR